ncbi:hypothetical protein NHQ30_006009 [Ciborinia camelliae]|nr:hypothetical protein NHQ30_006009 [Ciborinia camelliae]
MSDFPDAEVPKTTFEYSTTKDGLKRNYNSPDHQATAGATARGESAGLDEIEMETQTNQRANNDEGRDAQDVTKNVPVAGHPSGTSSGFPEPEIRTLQNARAKAPSSDWPGEYKINTPGLQGVVPNAVQYGAVQHRVDQHGAVQHDADQHGADQHGADQHGADQHGQRRRKSRSGSRKKKDPCLELCTLL